MVFVQCFCFTTSVAADSTSGSSRRSLAEPGFFCMALVASRSFVGNAGGASAHGISEAHCADEVDEAGAPVSSFNRIATKPHEHRARP